VSYTKRRRTFGEQRMLFQNFNFALDRSSLSPSELNAAGGASVGPSCQCLQAIPN
jgi:hypothetical protein